MITDVIVRMIIPNPNEQAWTGNNEKSAYRYQHRFLSLAYSALAC